jgi:hypothetical protein
MFKINCLDKKSTQNLRHPKFKSYKLTKTIHEVIFFAEFLLPKFFNSVAKSAGNGISEPQFVNFYWGSILPAGSSCLPAVFALS